MNSSSFADRTDYRFLAIAAVGLLIFGALIGLFIYFQLYPDREIARTEPVIVEGTTSCNYYGYCYGPTTEHYTEVVNGRSTTSTRTIYTYRYGNCSGRRPATFSVVTVTTDSDREWLLAGVRQREERTLVAERGECQ